MTRAEWLASLQTFDRVWHVRRMQTAVVMVLGDGRIQEASDDPGFDANFVTEIYPLPAAPFGTCAKCDRVLRDFWHENNTCLRCDRKPYACPGGCATKEEHEAALLAQRRYWGMAPNEGEHIH